MNKHYEYSSKELLKVFKIKGRYYQLNDILCRSHLLIEKVHPDEGMIFVSIMMNPGKSKQKNYLGDGYSEADPDRTQYQLMKLMLKVNISQMHIINLSDIREPNSKKFYGKIKNFEEALKYSIFSNERKDELQRILLRTDGVICAWGVHEKLAELSAVALKTVQGVKTYGIRKNEGSAYYHPLQRKNPFEWLMKMENLFKEDVKQGNQS